MVGRRRTLVAAFLFAAALVVPLASGGAQAAQTRLASGATHASSPHVSINCEYSRLCPDLANNAEVYGDDEYVGHDEPSLLYYSNTPGAGNHMQYTFTLPKGPTPVNPTTPGKSYNFQLNGAIWFGMALCDTQSYPEQVSTCTPDSDSNIVDPAVSPNHPGTAFLELQFYPPGWVPWPTWAQAIGAGTCDPRKWCAAMNVFSLLEDPVNGTLQNPTCASQVGIETFQFAFVTKSGVSHAPANQLQSTLATYTPNKNKDLFMRSGDKIRVRIQDTPDGVQTSLNDQTSGESGSMTASPQNGFGQIQYDPSGSSCNLIPYAFHPMYSTASEQTRVIWAAHSYNVAFSDEIGHFEYCTGPNAIPVTQFGAACPAGDSEGPPGDTEPTDGDDDTCFPASMSLRVQVGGCTETNAGFDGLDYTPVWPDGNTKLHPTPIQFTSPLTGNSFNQPYDRVAFEADLPAIETGVCNRSTGAGCTLIPQTDDGQPAAFYPFFSTGTTGGKCAWRFGNDTPGMTSDFAKNAQYGALLPLTYLAFGGHGATVTRFNDFRNIIANPC